MDMRLSMLAGIALLGIACSACNGATVQAASKPFTASPVATFDEPWAMAFLPDGRVLVTEKKGALKLLAVGGIAGDVRGVPRVAYGGQGGFGDIALHPHFADNHVVYLSYAEEGEGGTRGAVVARAKLELDAQGGGALSELYAEAGSNRFSWVEGDLQLLRQVPAGGGARGAGARTPFTGSGPPRLELRRWAQKGLEAGRERPQDDALGRLAADMEREFTFFSEREVDAPAAADKREPSGAVTAPGGPPVR